MEIRTDIKNDESLRLSFFDLARKVFDLDFSSWYENGFWTDAYRPYCLVSEGAVISNISVCECNLRWRENIHHLAQLGCVATKKDARGRGYAKQLMEKVTDDCDRSFEGVFLYTMEDMIPFYEKFGFRRLYEWQYTKKVNITSKATVEKIPMDSKEEWDRMVDIIRRRSLSGDMVMVGNPGLYMFYLTGAMSDNVCYIPSCEAYVVAKENSGNLKVFAVFSDTKVSLGDVISSFGSGINSVQLAFTPGNNTGFEQSRMEDPDSVLMVRGTFFSNIKNEHFMLPEIAHT